MSGPLAWPADAPPLAEAHEYSIRNSEQLAASTLAACYYCRSQYPASEVSEYTDDGATALCPYCGIDAVLGDQSGYPLTPDALQMLRAFWF